MNPTERPSQLLDGFSYLNPVHTDLGNGMELSLNFAPYAGTAPNPSEGPKPPKPHTACMFDKADGTKCRGPRAKGTEFCIGHLRSLAKQEAAHESD